MNSNYIARGYYIREFRIDFDIRIVSLSPSSKILLRHLLILNYPSISVLISINSYLSLVPSKSSYPSGICTLVSIQTEYYHFRQDY